VITAGVAFFLIFACAIIGACAAALVWLRMMKNAKFGAGFTSSIVKALRADPEAAHELAHKLEGLPCPMCSRPIDFAWCREGGRTP
jgi:hypothetical protein